MAKARKRRRDGFWTRQRKNFLTGLAVLLPLYLTYWIISSAVSLIDEQARQALPTSWNPQTYLDLPGLGLVIFAVLTVLAGALARNLIIAQIISWGENMLERLPIVRSVYNALKQIAETIFSDTQRSFERACLVEYPRRGCWVLGFIATTATGEVARKLGEEPQYAIFVPTTPNPTSGFLIYAPKSEVKELAMTVEDAAKLIVSAGLVAPNEQPKTPSKAKPPARPSAPKG